MTMRISRLALLHVVVVAQALVPRAAGAQGEFHWKGKVAQGKAIEIKGVNGGVRAVAGSGNVEGTAVKHPRRSDPNEGNIEVVQHEDGVTICDEYPSDGRRVDSLKAGKCGHINVRNAAVILSFTV